MLSHHTYKSGIFVDCLQTESSFLSLQDHLHEATRCVEDTLVSNLNAANSQGKRPPWRIQRKRFNQDTCYIWSGAANLSPAWFTPGSNVGLSDAHQISLFIHMATYCLD